MISFLERLHKGEGNDSGGKLRKDNGEPDAVDAKDEREEQDCDDLKYQRAQKGYDRGDESVVECGEKSRSEDGNSAEEEGEGIEEKSAPSGEGEEIKAGLPGNVLRIEVSEGDTVAEGDVLLVVEAMKMETEVKAPKAGTVQSVLVAPGDKVVNGSPLVTLG